MFFFWIVNCGQAPIHGVKSE